MKYIDRYLNKITMYRFVLYGLAFLAVLSVLFGYTGQLGFSGSSILVSLVTACVAGWAAHYFFTKLYGFSVNNESSLITTLILFLIFSPSLSLEKNAILVTVIWIAVASKFVVAVNKKHIFNPAALAAVIAGLIGLAQATWWVGNSTLAIFIAIFGALLLRKLHRFELFFSFLVIAVFMTLLRDYSNTGNIAQLVKTIIISSPLLFLGTVMLTEPSTIPPTRRLRIIYGSIVGLLYGVGVSWLTPEIALIFGNIFAYISSSSLRRRYTLQLQSRKEIAPTIYEYKFTSNKKTEHKPGQYIDLTLPLAKSDTRGSRRTFTIASSPNEEVLRIIMKYNNPSSTFKENLRHLPVGSRLFADHVAGDFILPNDTSQKIIWLAAGVGITPFISMAKYLIDTNQNRDITLFHQVSDVSHFIYKDIFKVAHIKVVYICSGLDSAPNIEQGLITSELIKRNVPDHKERLYYLSGPDAAVRYYQKQLNVINISKKRVISDYFSGY